MRRSAIVRAVESARPSVVNINGHKTVSGESGIAESDGTKRVNGMGTGVVIDERGYIITNYHVVEGVAEIRVTLADGDTFLATMVAHDPVTDLAVIKIPAREKLPLIPVGVSSDLMQGERVVAIGNAYGYEHTVTCGFISALSRSVQVSDSQKYEDLIQTDASINPGNSGGPLLNVDGEMVGINVAVRVGAQNIAFAIKVDKVMDVAAELMSIERLSGLSHGLLGDIVVNESERCFVVRSVRQDSPAALVGIAPGDRIRSVGERRIQSRLDLERALLGRSEGERVSLTVQRNNEPLEVTLAMAPATQLKAASTFKTLGMELVPVTAESIRQAGSRYQGGLQVTAVTPNSSAARQGIRAGDILVGMHIWETLSLENVKYVLRSPEVSRAGTVKFYVVRGSQTLYGNLPVVRR
jgi:serine protease Do